MNLYQEALMDHYRNPRNRGKLSEPDFSSGMVNPSCGDAVTVQGRLKDDLITECFFEGTGCVISQATASMLMAKICGKSVADIKAMNGQTMQSMIGMQLGPTRLKCALLPLEAVKKGINA